MRQEADGYAQEAKATLRHIPREETAPKIARIRVASTILARGLGNVEKACEPGAAANS